MPVGGDDFEFEDGFRCAAKGESGWQEVGSIVFQPSGLERPVLAGSKVVAQLHKGDPFSADADFTGPVRVSAKSDKGELLHLKADSNGAFLLVNGKDGRAGRTASGGQERVLAHRGYDGRSLAASPAKTIEQRPRRSDRGRCRSAPGRRLHHGPGKATFRKPSTSVFRGNMAAPRTIQRRPSTPASPCSDWRLEPEPAQ